MVLRSYLKRGSGLIHLNIILGFVLVLIFVGLVILPKADFSITGMVTSDSSKPSFTLNKDLLEVSFFEGGEVTRNLMIYNTRHFVNNISVNLTSGLSNLVNFQGDNFTLGAKGSKLLKLNFSSADVEPGTYSGVLSVTDGSLIQEVVLNLEIRSFLSSLSFNLRKEASSVLLGDVLYSDFIVSGGDAGEVNLTLLYGLKDKEGNVYSKDGETFVFNGSKTFRKAIGVPSNLMPGDYEVYAEISYRGQSKTETYPVEVIERKSFFDSNLFYYLFGAFVLFLIIRGFVRWRMKERKIKRSIIQMDALANYDEDAEEEESDDKESKDKSGKDEDDSEDGKESEESKD